MFEIIYSLRSKIWVNTLYFPFDFILTKKTQHKKCDLIEIDSMLTLEMSNTKWFVLATEQHKYTDIPMYHTYKYTHAHTTIYFWRSHSRRCVTFQHFISIGCTLFAVNVLHHSVGLLFSLANILYVFCSPYFSSYSFRFANV